MIFLLIRYCEKFPHEHFPSFAHSFDSHHRPVVYWTSNSSRWESRKRRKLPLGVESQGHEHFLLMRYLHFVLFLSYATQKIYQLWSIWSAIVEDFGININDYIVWQSQNVHANNITKRAFDSFASESKEFFWNCSRQWHKKCPRWVTIYYPINLWYNSLIILFYNNQILIQFLFLNSGHTKLFTSFTSSSYWTGHMQWIWLVKASENSWWGPKNVFCVITLQQMEFLSFLLELMRQIGKASRQLLTWGEPIDINSWWMTCLV